MMQVTQKKSAEVLEMTDFDEDKAIGIIVEERKQEELKAKKKEQ